MFRTRSRHAARIPEQFARPNAPGGRHSKERMLRVRLTSYLQLLWGSGFTAFNVAFVAFWLLWVPEAVWISIGGAGPTRGTTADLAWTLLDVAAILAVYGLVYAILFQVLFFVIRLGAALLSHGRSLISKITPGLAVFALLGEPLLRQAGLYFESTQPALLSGGVLWAIAPPALLLSLAIGAVLIYLSPAFRGYNAIFVLIAAAFARLVLFPFDPAPGATGFLIYELTLLLTAFFIFINLQIRYRLHLWPNYESVEVPERFVHIGGTIALVCAGLYVAVESPWFYSRLSTGSPERAVYFIPTAVWFVCAAQWTLTTWLLDRGRLVSLARQKERIQAALLRSLSIAIVGLLAVLFVVTAFPRDGLARISATHSASSELLYLAGVLLDRDGDGNSLWPGQDPDDGDPCVRADLHRGCATASRSNDERDSALAPTAAILHNPAAPGIPRLAAANIILLSWVTPESAIPETTPAIPLHFAANRPEYALRTMLNDTDGIDEPATGTEVISLPSRLARRGFRTICAGRAIGQNYYRTGHAAHLDAGCQVFQPLEDLARNSGAPAPAAKPSTQGQAKTPASNINRTVLEALFVFERYREPGSNFLWIHYHADPKHAGPRPGLERETLYRLQQSGDVILVQLQPEEFRGNAYLLGKRQPRVVPEYPRPGELLRFAAGLQRTLTGSAHEQLVAIYRRSFSDSWFVRAGRRLGWEYPAQPVHTMRLDSAGMPVFFNALTGARTLSETPVRVRE